MPFQIFIFFRMVYSKCAFHNVFSQNVVFFQNAWRRKAICDFDQLVVKNCFDFFNNGKNFITASSTIDFILWFNLISLPLGPQK